MPAQATRSARRAAREAKKRNQRIMVISVLVIIVSVVALILVYNYMNKGDDFVTTASGLQYQDLVVGEGPAAQTGDTVVVHYTGWLLDGTKFDSSLDLNRPFDFTIGQGLVIAGWEEGVAGMQAGGTRKLVIPAELAYGDRGAGNIIPPNATLVFEVELLEIK